MDELGVELEVRDRREPGVLVSPGVQRQPVPRPDPHVALRPELGPGPKQREVDVEEHCSQHEPRIRPASEVAVAGQPNGPRPAGEP